MALRHADTHGQGAVLLVAGGTGLLVALAVLLAHFDAANAGRDVQAEQVLAGLVRAPMLLYLRPFAADGRMKTERNPVEAALDDVLLLNALHLTGFESALLRAAGPDLSVVQIDLPVPPFRQAPLQNLRQRLRPRIGACRRPDWKALFEQLVHRADLCLVVPPHAPDAWTLPNRETGTAWEIRRLQALGYLGKTVFLMPRRASRISASRGKSGKPTADQAWSRLLGATGLDSVLPAYHREGGLAVPVKADRPGYTLIQGLQGAPWDAAATLRGVARGGELRCHPARDAAWFVLCMGLWYPAALMILSILLFGLVQAVGIRLPDWGLLAVPFAAVLLWHAEHCGRYVLPAPHRRVLFWGSTGVLLVGVAIADRWMALRTPTLAVWAPADELLGLALVWLQLSAGPVLAVFVLAWAIFRCRPVIEAAFGPLSPHG